MSAWVGVLRCFPLGRARAGMGGWEPGDETIGRTPAHSHCYFSRFECQPLSKSPSQVASALAHAPPFLSWSQPSPDALPALCSFIRSCSALRLLAELEASRAAQEEMRQEQQAAQEAYQMVSWRPALCRTQPDTVYGVVTAVSVGAFLYFLSLRRHCAVVYVGGWRGQQPRVAQHQQAHSAQRQCVCVCVSVRACLGPAGVCSWNGGA